MASVSHIDREGLAVRSRARAVREADRGVERQLADSDLFFSTTDGKGVITAGNRVFERVSGYALAEMLGRAHNIVRHPDTPRAVFQLLWDTIAAGEPIAAYVKNRTADGGYYWVLASVVPISAGYLSVRLAPAGPHFAQAKAIYQELGAVEREIEGDDVRRRKPAIAASTKRLGELIGEAGYRDYRAFMREALSATVAGRAARLPAGHRQALATAPTGSPQAIIDILASYRLLSDFHGGLVTDLARYAQIGRALGEHSDYLREMGDSVSLFALNAQIGASRLGQQGAALDAVARLLTEQSHATSPLVATVARHAAVAMEEIEEMTFQLALSTIQAEMIAVFAHELAEHRDVSHAARANMLALADSLGRGSDRTFQALDTVVRQLEEVIGHVDGVATGVDRLRRLALNGRIEVANVSEAGSIRTLFSDVEHQVADAKARLGEFGAIKQAARDLGAAARHDAIHAADRLRAGAAALCPDEPATSDRDSAA
jgi:PAS domain S-box-containing protein